MEPSLAARRREWLVRAAFEAGLIVVGLIGALALNDWHDRRQRDQSVRDALASIRIELQSNLTSIVEVIKFNENLMGVLTESAKTGKPYMDRIVAGMDLSTTAWDAARDAGISNDIPFPILMVLGRAYTSQGGFVREIEFFLNQMYTGSVAYDMRKEPLGLRGILSDYTHHARRLRQHYQDALAALP